LWLLLNYLFRLLNWLLIFQGYLVGLRLILLVRNNWIRILAIMTYSAKIRRYHLILLLNWWLKLLLIGPLLKIGLLKIGLLKLLLRKISKLLLSWGLLLLNWIAAIILLSKRLLKLLLLIWNVNIDII